MNKPTECPKCKSKKVKKIVYGLLKRRSLWKIFLPRDWIGGGCCVSEDSPAWYCASCKHSWGTF